MSERAAPHLIECNYQRGPIGGEGCICKVVNKNQFALLLAELKKLDPDPVVCNCREALCPHTPIAQLPRQELVKHYKERIHYLTGCVRDLTAALEKRDG